MNQRKFAVLLAAFLSSGLLSGCTPVNRLKPGVTMRDIYDAVDERLSGVVASPAIIDDFSLANTFQLSSKDVEEYYGKRSTQGPDVFLCVKAKKGRESAVRKGLEERLRVLNRQYENDKLSTDYQKVLSGKVFSRDVCYFLLVTGRAQSAFLKDTQFTAQTNDAEETVHSFFE